MRESESSDRETTDDSERPGEGRPQSPDTTTTAPDPDAASPPKPRRKFALARKPSRRLLAFTGAVIVGLAALGGGVFGLVWAFTRVPNSAQLAAAGSAESARQWRWLPAGKIFPAVINYKTSQGTRTHATLVGIAPQAPCAKALDTATAKTADKAGCLTVLRATYADASDTVVTTVGVAVMKSRSAADKADAAFTSAPDSGVLPAAFPATVAAEVNARGRLLTDEQEVGRYLIFSASGYADGRKAPKDPTADLAVASQTGDLSTTVNDQTLDRLSPPSNPCADREVRC